MTSLGKQEMNALAVEKTKAEEAEQEAMKNSEAMAAALAAARDQQSSSEQEAEQVDLHANGVSL